MNSKVKNNRIEIVIRTLALVLVASFLLYNLPAYSQEKFCTKTTIKQINETNIPLTQGNTNEDPAFNDVQPFVDLDLPQSPGKDFISSCVFKNTSARILGINPGNGSLNISPSVGITDPVRVGDPGSLRGTCSLSPLGGQLYFPGIGPAAFGFDRIYSYKVLPGNPPTLIRSMDGDVNDFFIPSDLATSTTVTPNSKYVVYLQANTTNENLASIQSIPIKENEIFDSAFIGQALSKAVKAGTYIEYANNIDGFEKKFVFGAFSNLKQGESASGNSFGIFKTNQKDGLNFIIAEFAKGSSDSPLPALFNNEQFVGFSGFKLIEKNGELFLFVSYVENNLNNIVNNFNYITKLALFKVKVRSDLARTATLELIGKPISTVFKTAPCSENNLHGIAGPIAVVDNTVYIADNDAFEEISKNENYLGAYFIDWDSVETATSETQIIFPSSVPIRTNLNKKERNTDLIVTHNNKFAYVATSNILENINPKVIGFSLEKSNVQCSDLKKELKGICDFDNNPPVLVKEIPDQTVKVNEEETISLNNFFNDESEISYTLTNNPASGFVSIKGNKIEINPTKNSQVGFYPEITVKATDKGGLSITESFNLDVHEATLTTDDTTATPPEVPSPQVPTPPPIIQPIPPPPIFPTAPPPPSGDIGGAPSIGAPPIPDAGRPPSFGEPSPAPPPLPPPTLPPEIPRPPKPPKLPTLPPSIGKPPLPPKPGTPTSEPKLPPELPNIDLIPTETKPISSDTSQAIDIKSLDLSGPDQIILSPSIPQFIFTDQGITIPAIEIIEEDKEGELESDSVEKPKDKPAPKAPPATSPPTIEIPPASKPSKPKPETPANIPEVPFAPIPATDIDIATSCCSCETGKLVCAENAKPICNGGRVKCIGGGGKTIACCRGKLPVESCNGDDATIRCISQNLKSKKPEEKEDKVKLIPDQAPIETKITRGAINKGNSGFVIFLKPDKKLTKGDLKYVLHILIDAKKNITILPSKTYILGTNKILVDLNIPNNLEPGSYLFATLVNRGGGKKDVIAKGNIEILKSYDYKNVSLLTGKKVKMGPPKVEKVVARIGGTDSDGTKIIRLIIHGHNFASRLIEINGRLFIAKPLTSNTLISFAEDKDIDIIRTRVLTKGTKMLVILKYTGKDITKIPFTISTPKGQFFQNETKFSVLTDSFERDVPLTLDKTELDKDKKEK